mmetsp:Transcript_1332/g.3184  ORF Transcript_1332/g.3184 Transcript_1332/m.3184 type:complete len:279 (-) Transcript_1332:852-1688(-)
MQVAVQLLDGIEGDLLPTQIEEVRGISLVHRINLLHAPQHALDAPQIQILHTRPPLEPRILRIDLSLNLSSSPPAENARQQEILATHEPTPHIFGGRGLASLELEAAGMLLGKPKDLLDQHTLQHARLSMELIEAPAGGVPIDGSAGAAIRAESLLCRKLKGLQPRDGNESSVRGRLEVGVNPVERRQALDAARHALDLAVGLREGCCIRPGGACCALPECQVAFILSEHKILQKLVAGVGMDILVAPTPKQRRALCLERRALTALKDTQIPRAADWS